MANKTTNIEEQKLKAKINGLIDRITDLGNILQNKDTQIQLLEEEIRMHLQKQNFSGAQEINLNSGTQSKIYSFMYDFCLIASLIIENEDYIKYSYATKYSESFYKIEQSIFENYICKYSRLDLRTFLNFCINLSLVKSEPNRKCIYNSAELRVYYVSRVFMDAAAKKDEPDEQEE